MDVASNSSKKIIIRDLIILQSLIRESKFHETQQRSNSRTINPREKFPLCGSVLLMLYGALHRAIVATIAWLTPRSPHSFVYNTYFQIWHSK